MAMMIMCGVAVGVYWKWGRNGLLRFVIGWGIISTVLSLSIAMAIASPSPYTCTPSGFGQKAECKIR